MWQGLQTWKKIFAIALMLIGVTMSLAHKIDATFEPGHAEHCGICLLGSDNPAHQALPVLPVAGHLSSQLSVGPLASRVCFNRWPHYSSRAPPLGNSFQAA